MTYNTALSNRSRHLPARYGRGALRFLTLCLSLIFTLPAFAQVPSREPVRGAVYDSDDYALTGATVRWLNGGGTTVGADGTFVLPPEAGATVFEISYLGFATQTFSTDTISGPVEVVMLEAGTALGEVEVTARDDGRSASILKTRNVETVTSKELRKAPCCSLAESFENSPVVDLTYGDPLTGRREIQMLGLRGNYTLLSLEKRPMFEGFGSPYALDYIPGPWVRGIQIGKGSGSLESGHQGMTGEINTELIRPIDGPKLHLNGFAGSQGRFEGNVLANHRLSEQLSAGIALHGRLTNNNEDHDSDGFKDMPDRETGYGLLRLFRQGGGNWEGQWNVYGAKDFRRGGQFSDGENPNPYRIVQDNRRLEAWGKTGYFGFAKPHQSIGFIYSAALHDLNNRYGERLHTGRQHSYYLTSLYHSRIADDRHQISLGGTARADAFDEIFDEKVYDRDERTVGAFGEYTFHWEATRTGAPYRAFTAIIGIRADHHNLGGAQFSPRLNVKYNPNDRTALRASAGRWWRSPNLLVDNLNWLPTSRSVIAGDENSEEGGDNPGFIGLESAWNFGGNLTTDIPVKDRPLQLVIDLYHTRFTDQLIIDAEQDATTLRIYQLDGISRANSFLLSLNYEVLPRIDVKLAYKFNDVRQTYATNGLREVPLVPRHRGLATVGYDGTRFKAHFNYQWVGPQRLIDFDILPDDISVNQPQRSPAFGLLNAQFTYVANAKTEIYFGGENLTNVQQSNAVIGADAPLTGSYFDASQVYQPLFMARGFIGVRYTVE